MGRARVAVGGVVSIRNWADDVEASPVPAMVVALTVTVYRPSASPPIVHLSAPVVAQVFPPGDAVAVYPVTALPPLEAGADQLTWAEEREGTAATPVGAPGTDRGVTGAEGAEAGPVPAMFVAVTVKVYACPFTSPVTAQVRAPVVVQVFPPSDEVAVYPVIGLPPLLAGASQETETLALPEAPATAVGDPGTVLVVTGFGDGEGVAATAAAALTRP